MAATPNITGELLARCFLDGYIQDIGQVTPEMKRVLLKAVRIGRMVKCFTLFPYLIEGCSSRKMTYVKTDAQPIDPLVDRFFIREGERQEWMQRLLGREA